MAKNNNLTDFLTGIANKFRSVLKTSKKINPQSFESAIDEVYEKATDDFWAVVQNVDSSGTAGRRSYNNAFMNWGVVNFKPKYDVSSTTTDWRYSFYACKKMKTIDLSGWTYGSVGINACGYMFYDCRNLTTLDWNKNFKFSPKSAEYLLYNCSSLKELKNFDLSETQNLTNAFKGCTSLEMISPIGLLYCSADLSDCPLTADGAFPFVTGLDWNWSDTPRTITYNSATESRYRAKYDNYNTGTEEEPQYTFSWDYNVMLYSGFGNWTIAVI